VDDMTGGEDVTARDRWRMYATRLWDFGDRDSRVLSARAPCLRDPRYPDMR
jgi:hypothetical protein